MFGFIKEIYRGYTRDEIPRLAAALAYYSLFSLAPLLIIAIAIAGYVFGRDAAQGQIVEELKNAIGMRASQAVQQLILSASRPSSSIPATITGIILSLYGASQVFNHLNISLNRIWKVRKREGLGYLSWLKNRLFLILAVLSFGLFFLLSLIFSTALQWATSYFGFISPLPWLFRTAASLLPFFLTTLLFIFIFKFIPDVKIRWGPLFYGSVFTSILFNLIRSILVIYLERSFYRSTYGAAASLVVLLLWIYFSAQILFLGAEFTRIYAMRHNEPILPAPGAESYHWEIL
ncbi:MAG: YihY/virulence factor BrkB family protein [Fibrobacter sp.]|nr:YihY/virulence factor BrkB family protein [Fibrobacter sp.]